MSRRPFILLYLLVAGCATGAPATPRPWAPGLYHLEATVTYRGGISTRRDTHSAELFVASDGSMRLDSDSGICIEPTPAERRRDEARGVRTFRCGDAMFVLRPGADTVFGNLLATVEEEYTVSRCIRYGTNASGARVCQEYLTEVRTRTVAKEARLLVSERS